MENLISIIIPVYNMEKYLKKCLDSVIRQTYKSLEIILVNDGSNDSSLSICQEYAIKDERIVVVDKKNGGQGSARNAGMEIATGEWIGFIDSDDWIVDDMYEVLLQHCLTQKADIAICDVFTTVLKNEKEDIRIMEYDTFYPELIYDHISSHPCNKFFRRSLFEENSHGKIRFPMRNSVDDMMIMPEIFDDARRIIITNRKLYCYFNTRQDSVSNSKSTTHLNSYERSIAFQKRYEICKKKGYDVDEVFSKAISFGIGAFGRMYSYKRKYLGELHNFRSYIKNHRRQIIANSHLEMGRKMACMLIDIAPDLYNIGFKLYERFSVMEER